VARSNQREIRRPEDWFPPAHTIVPAGGAVSALGFLAINIENLPDADPAEPLYEFEAVYDVNFNGTDAITARVAATGATVFPIKKDGAANGNITITGGSGVATLTDASYEAGSLFSLYPPAVADTTLDGVRISLGTS
jgi:hypothetical protein